MLAGIQFPHPSSQPSETFELFPFRLIFKLLLDERLEGKLFNFEVYQYLIYLDTINLQIYEKLVEDILKSRKISDSEKFDILKSNEESIVKSVYEWEYYVLKLLTSQGILINNLGDDLGKLYHPTKSLNTKKTGRKVTSGSFTLNPELKSYISKLIEKYSVYDKVLKLNDEKRQTSDIVKEIYAFYPEILLEELGLSSTGIDNEIIKLPKLIEKYSLNEDGKTYNQFEDILEDAFNLFYNVEAQKLSGPGRTDIECMYLSLHEKFSVEAKSTSKNYLH
ncbi:Type II restriction enzyme HgAI (Endonuclease HgAI) [Streptococcus sp. HSISB1]|nr:Type II restriction enzyme HgAI (Endonuclease HgAI) [Streptococcus sp. HSISB1]